MSGRWIASRRARNAPKVKTPSPLRGLSPIQIVELGLNVASAASTSRLSHSGMIARSGFNSSRGTNLGRNAMLQFHVAILIATLAAAQGLRRSWRGPCPDCLGSQPLPRLCLVDDEARMATSRHRVDGVAHCHLESHAPPVHLSHRHGEVDPHIDQRCRQMVDLDARTDGILAIVEMIEEKVAAGDPGGGHEVR